MSCIQSVASNYAIAPQGQWILTGGATPGVRAPSLFSLLHPGGVPAMPIAERLLCHCFSYCNRSGGG